MGGMKEKGKEGRKERRKKNKEEEEEELSLSVIGRLNK